MRFEERISIGCDPEIFVRDSKTKMIVSAHDLVKGTKYAPEFVEQGAVQVDGMALEFNIFPAYTLSEFLGNIKTVMGQLEMKMKAKNPDFEFEIYPVAFFQEEYLETVPLEAKILGCTPDYNAYTGKANPSPDAASTMRTASGHIHVGWCDDANPKEAEHFNDCREVTKQLDAVLYNCSLLWDKDKLRRDMYGAKGAFRPKPYGVEYRVLSNAWLKDDRLAAWVYQATMKAMEYLKEGIRFYTKDSFSVLSPEYVHEMLVQNYDFPRLPGRKGLRVV